jgi:hypothetical protein
MGRNADAFACGTKSDAREGDAVGDVVGLRRFAQTDLLESHIRGLAARTPPWRSRTRADAVQAMAFSLRSGPPPCGWGQRESARACRS